ncbi:MAG TPA: DUF1345 domain-containing protein [Gaiellaceae bacterium]|nr:DUF1345 domain-containing protein [Gaiellaceae bacterium]
MHGLAQRRLAVSAVVGVAAGVVALVAGAGWAEVVLALWDGTAVTYLALVWRDIWGKNATRTSALSQSEDASRAASESILLGAGVASLIAVVFTLEHASDESGSSRVAITLFALVSVVLAWMCVHTVYTLRYARLYYAPPVGGIDFPPDDPPDYHDFAYVAFTIGMTYQVSDTGVSTKRLRRVLIRHALLSYLYGAVILAVAINAVAGLLGR